MKCILALFLILFACVKSPPSPLSSSLRLVFNTSPLTFDPRKSGDFLSSTLICLIYEGLTRCMPGGSVEPALAEAWTISEDGKTYLFTLRSSFWTDGRPVTAYDFERSWKKILDPSFPSPSAYLLFPIKNAEKYIKREATFEEVGICALNTHTLKIELERPTPFFLSLTAFPLFLPAPSDDEVSGDVCNGPFQVAKYKANSEILLVKNPRFWNFEQTHFEEIRIQIIPDETTAFELFERGEIDWLGSPLAPLPLDALPSLKNKLQFIPMAASTILAFNTKIFPFQSLKLRKALSLCLDRNRIACESALVGQIPAKRTLPPSLFQKPLKPLFGDADWRKANMLLQESLNELNATPADLEALTLYFKPTQIERRLAQVLQRQWKEALGFTIRIEQLDPQTHLHRLHQRDYQIALCAWIAQFCDPINLLERYRLSSNQKNYAGWENSHYAALLEQATGEMNPEKRFSLLIAAEEILADELPIVPLYHWTSPTLANPRVQQIATTPTGGILFERFTMK